MKVLLAGGTGYLGGFISQAVHRQGWQLEHLARRPPEDGNRWHAFDLGAPPEHLPRADVLVHAAFDHVPGRYRGGEGDEPERFMQHNRDGSIALFHAAAHAGIGRVIFLSTRAVYGAYPPGTLLDETLTPRPDTLYGEMKWQVEQALADHSRSSGPATASLRITGVYGRARPGGWHKWADLFAAFDAGETIAPRRGTEVHGTDVAAAIVTVIAAPPDAIAGRCFNVSDLLLDRHDLLAAYRDSRGLIRDLPPRATAPAPNVMATERLAALGWVPGGPDRLAAFLREI